jgi:hypothetical protein
MENDVQGDWMHRTQIYFDEPLFEALKRQASTLGLSLSAYIREVLKKDLEMKKREKKSLDFSDFSGMWKERDIDQKSLREKAWK